MPDPLRDVNTLLVDQFQQGSRWLGKEVYASRRNGPAEDDWRQRLVRDEFTSSLGVTFSKDVASVKGQAAQLYRGGAVGFIVLQPPEKAAQSVCVLHVRSQVSAQGWSQLRVATGFFNRSDDNLVVNFYGFRFETPSNWIAGQLQPSAHNFFHVQLIQAIDAGTSLHSWKPLNTSAPAIPLCLPRRSFVELQLVALAMASLHGEFWFDEYLGDRQSQSLSHDGRDAIRGVRDSIWDNWRDGIPTPIS